MKALTTPATRDLRHMAISTVERFCKEVKRRCAAPWLGQIVSGGLEPPVCKETLSEKANSVEFLVSQRLTSKEFGCLSGRRGN